MRVGVAVDGTWTRRNPFPSEPVGKRGVRGLREVRGKGTYVPAFIAASITVSDRPKPATKVTRCGLTHV